MVSAVKSAAYVAALVVAGVLMGCRGDTPIGDPCTNTMECVPNSICFHEYCVGEGALRVSLAFDVVSDFDLHLLAPGGSEIYFANPSAEGGTLDVDQCISNGCPTGQTHVENIVFSTSAPSGSYQVWVENYNGGGSGSYSIEISGGSPNSFSGTLPATSGAEGTHHTFTK